MPNFNLSYPKICKRNDGKYYIDFRLNSIRYRLFSGKLIGSSLSPNSYPTKLRYSATKKLANEVYKFIISNDYSLTKKQTSLEEFNSLIRRKLSEPLSYNYKKTLKNISEEFRLELKKNKEIKSSFISSLILKYDNNTSFNSKRKHVNVIVNYLKRNGFTIDDCKIQSRKQEEKLHKAINDVKGLLNEIKSFDHNLYLCCLLTYGCLLRPHQEIRLLKWSNFSPNLSYIYLDGHMVKSKRIRKVPVPNYIRSSLSQGSYQKNIFSNLDVPFNKYYFKSLWYRFKKSRVNLPQNTTIYSFRHSGAIELFKRTGSISKLQKAMGHSSIKVSLTYLRGLEIPELEEDDMPSI